MGFFFSIFININFILALRVYPKKHQQYKISPEMRKAVRKLEQYTAEANLMCKYKLETLKDVKSYKEKV